MCNVEVSGDSLQCSNCKKVLGFDNMILLSNVDVENFECSDLLSFLQKGPSVYYTLWSPASTCNDGRKMQYIEANKGGYTCRDVVSAANPEMVAHGARLSPRFPQLDGPIPDAYDDMLSTPNAANQGRVTDPNITKYSVKGLPNSSYFQNRSLLNKTKDIAAKKDIESLGDTEVENCMSLLRSEKALRDASERRILASLDFRQLSKDGQIRNPDEKSFVLRDAALPSEAEAAAETKVKQAKDDSICPPQHGSGRIQKVPKEAKGKQTGSGSTLEPLDIEKEISGLEKQQKDPPSKENELDAAKLKEMKKEEELEKYKQSMKRKKKLAEKAAAKAATKAQKEAEKKLKAREKKAKKKAGASVPAPDLAEPTDQADPEVSEPEKRDENVDDPVNTIRHQNRARMWAAPAGISMLMLLVVGYFYLLCRSKN